MSAMSRKQTLRIYSPCKAEANTVDQILAGNRFLTPTVAKARMVTQPSLPIGR